MTHMLALIGMSLISLRLIACGLALAVFMFHEAGALAGSLTAVFVLGAALVFVSFAIEAWRLK